MENSQSEFNIVNYAIIIIAAGSSSRLGSPKQLLKYNGKTLLQLSIDTAKASGARKVILVLGSGKRQIENEIDDKEIIVIENPDWELGMASSIIHGVNAIERILPDSDGIILMACDQPHLTPEVLQSLLLEQALSGNVIVGCSYANTKGIPALFHRSIFPELLNLTGDSGAKKLFAKYEHAASFVPFKCGGIDIDTSEDYKNLVK